MRDTAGPEDRLCIFEDHTDHHPALWERAALSQLGDTGASELSRSPRSGVDRREHSASFWRVVPADLEMEAISKRNGPAGNRLCDCAGSTKDDTAAGAVRILYAAHERTGEPLSAGAGQPAIPG